MGKASHSPRPIATIDATAAIARRENSPSAVQSIEISVIVADCRAPVFGVW